MAMKHAMARRIGSTLGARRPRASADAVYALTVERLDTLLPEADRGRIRPYVAFSDVRRRFQITLGGGSDTRVRGHVPNVFTCRTNPWPCRLAVAIRRRFVAEAAMIACAAALHPGRPAVGLPAAALSIHPVSAALLQASGIDHRQVRRLFAPSGRPTSVADADGALRGLMLKVVDGIVTVIRARIVDAENRAVVILRTRGNRLSAELVGFGSDTLASALPGRLPRDIVDLFGNDRRSDSAPVVAARLVGRRTPWIRVEFADVLVPLDPAQPGGEPWRPTAAAEPWPLPLLDRAFFLDVLGVAHAAEHESVAFSGSRQDDHDLIAQVLSHNDWTPAAMTAGMTAPAWGSCFRAPTPPSCADAV